MKTRLGHFEDAERAKTPLHLHRLSIFWDIFDRVFRIVSASLVLLLLNPERRLLACEMIRLELVEEVEDLDVGKGSSVGM